MPELEPKKIIALLGLLMPPVNFSHPYSNRIPFHVIHGCRKTPRIAAGCVFNGMLIHGKKGRSKPKKGNWRTNVASNMRASPGNTHKILDTLDQTLFGIGNS